MLDSEILNSLHVFMAPRPIKQLARSFNTSETTFPASFHRKKLYEAEHAPEAAYHVLHSDVDRVTMRRIIGLYLAQDATQTKEHLRRHLKMRTSGEEKSASDYAEDYHSIMKKYHSLQNPGIIAKTVDKVTNLLPRLWS